MFSPNLETVSPNLDYKDDRGQYRDIRRAVLTALQSSRYRPLWNLRCEVREGVLFLVGIVPSFFLKQVAQELLLQLGQFKEIRNLVEVYQGKASEARLGSAPSQGSG
jgi:hypothetical protein